jgi:hypothetical protein
MLLLDGRIRWGLCCAFVLDWRNMVKRNFLVTIIIYVFFGLTVLFQLNFSNELLSTFTLLDKAWTGYLTPSTAVSALMVPYTILLLMDVNAGVDEI